MNKIINRIWYVSMIALTFVLCYSYFDTCNSTVKKFESLEAELDLISFKLEAQNRVLNLVIDSINNPSKGNSPKRV